MTYKITLTMFLCACLFSIKTDAQMKLIAKTFATFRTSGSYSEDSTRYFHSGTKGNNPGKYKIPEFEYMEDSSHYYEYDAGTKKLVWQSRKVSKYTGNDFDESITYTLNNGSWRNSARTRIIYASGKPDTVYYDSWLTQGNGSWRASSRIIYTWNGNNIATRLRQTRGRQNWSNSRLYTYQYTGGNETEFIDQKWSNGAWVDTVKRTTTIAAGKITKVETFKSVSSVWQPEAQYFYEYDGNSRLIKIRQDIYFNGNWDENGLDTFMFNAGNTTAFHDTMMTLGFSFGNIFNKAKNGYERLPDGRMTSMNSLSWNNTAWVPTDNQDSIKKWYYGYNVGVNEVNQNNTTVGVYPSPASNSINITLDGLDKSRRVEFVIVDVQGRLMKNWTDEIKPVNTMTIDELPAGNYILLVNDGVQKASKKFVVSK